MVVIRCLYIISSVPSTVLLYHLHLNCHYHWSLFTCMYFFSSLLWLWIFTSDTSLVTVCLVKLVTLLMTQESCSRKKQCWSARFCRCSPFHFIHEETTSFPKLSGKFALVFIHLSQTFCLFWILGAFLIVQSHTGLGFFLVVAMWLTGKGLQYL
jgi:hypothetical protein